MIRIKLSRPFQKGSVCHITLPWICRDASFSFGGKFVWEGVCRCSFCTHQHIRASHFLYQAVTSLLICLKIYLIKAFLFYEFRTVATFPTCLGPCWFWRKPYCFFAILITELGCLDIWVRSPVTGRCTCAV